MKENRKTSVCFTGHRSFPCRESGRILLAVEKLIAFGYTDFYAGGAKGFDSRAAQTVLYLKKSHPQIRLHLILPCERERQVKGWSKEEILLYDHLRQYADTVSVLGKYSRGCMKKRNQALVDAASYCLCWYDGTNERSGTAQTVFMAKRDGLQIQNLFAE